MRLGKANMVMVRCSKMDFSEMDHGAGEGGPRCGKLAKKRKNWILASKCSVEEHICAYGVRGAHWEAKIVFLIDTVFIHSTLELK